MRGSRTRALSWHRCSLLVALSYDAAPAGATPVSSCTPPYCSRLHIPLNYPLMRGHSARPVECHGRSVIYTRCLHTAASLSYPPSLRIHVRLLLVAPNFFARFAPLHHYPSLFLVRSLSPTQRPHPNSHHRITRLPTPATHRCIYTCTYLSTLTTPPAHRSIPPSSSSSSPPLVIGKYGCFVKCIAHSTVPLIAMRYCSFGTCARTRTFTCRWILVIRSCFAYVQYTHTVELRHHAGGSGADRELVAAAGESPSSCIIVGAWRWIICAPGMSDSLCSTPHVW